MDQDRWKWTNVLRRSLSPGLCEVIYLIWSVLDHGRKWLLTFVNAVHPTPMMKVCLCLFASGIVVDVDGTAKIQPIGRFNGNRQPGPSGSLEEIIDELGDYTDVHTISYQPVFTLRSDPCWPSKRSGIGTEPKKPR